MGKQPYSIWWEMKCSQTYHPYISLPWGIITPQRGLLPLLKHPGRYFTFRKCGMLPSVGALYSLPTFSTIILVKLCAYIIVGNINTWFVLSGRAAATQAIKIPDSSSNLDMTQHQLRLPVFNNRFSERSRSFKCSHTKYYWRSQIFSRHVGLPAVKYSDN